MTQRYRAVIFDLGGVLVDWDPRNLYRRFFTGDAAGMERFLSEIDFNAWNLEQDRGRSFADGVAALSAKFPHYADLIHAYDQFWEESITGPIQGSVDVLRALKAAGCAVSLLSNISREKFEVLQRTYDFFSEFEACLISADAQLLKPDPRIYALLLARIKRAAAECVFIDDSAVNVAGADRAGLTARRFESPAQLKTDLQQLGLLD